MKTILIKKYNNEKEAIKYAADILKEALKKGDVILTKPRLNILPLSIFLNPSISHPSLSVYIFIIFLALKVSLHTRLCQQCPVRSDPRPFCRKEASGCLPGRHGQSWQGT